MQNICGLKQFSIIEQLPNFQGSAPDRLFPTGPAPSKKKTGQTVTVLFIFFFLWTRPSPTVHVPDQIVTAQKLKNPTGSDSHRPYCTCTGHNRHSISIRVKLGRTVAGGCCFGSGSFPRCYLTSGHQSRRLERFVNFFIANCWSKGSFFLGSVCLSVVGW